MSRVGKLPVVIPAGVDVSIKEDQISVKGAGGTLSLGQNILVKVLHNNDKLSFEPANESREANAMSGTLRQLVNNMVVGVSKGFEKKLSLVGVGYKAQASGSKLNLSVGFSHPVDIEMPAGITVATPSPTEVVIKGADRQRVGQIAAEIRAVRPPEPYKGKGIRYADEKITIKEQRDQEEIRSCTMLNKKEQRLRRARQTRIRIAQQGVARLTVNRTNLHIYASVISGDGSRVLASASTLEAEVRQSLGGAGKGGNAAAAQLIGKRIAEKAKAAGIEKVAFDRSGFAYHGRVKALAEAAREAGLQF